MAALIALRDRCRRAEIVLVDPGSYHVNRTRLHERIRHPQARCRIPFGEITRRYRCRHVAAEVGLSQQALALCQANLEITFENHIETFDDLVITTGSCPLTFAALAETLTPDDLADLDWDGYARQRLDSQSHGKPWISVIGAGASGIQIVFELDAWRRQWKRSTGQSLGLRLVTADRVPLPSFPGPIREYAMAKMIDAGIECVTQTEVSGSRERSLKVRHRVTGKALNFPSDVTFACLGQRPNPLALRANAFGQVLDHGQVLRNIFAAGDCARYEGSGANTPSAQTATRKGQLVAKNIARSHLNLPLLSYRYQEQGYFISMGPGDGAGWLGQPENVVTGLPAFFIKETVETLYDLSIL